MHGRPQFLSSAVPVLLFWSLPYIAHNQHNGHPFFIVVSNTLFLVASCQVTFSILLTQNAVISFNCRSLTITCCNSMATCAPISSLTAEIYALLYTNLQAKFLKIWGLKSLNAATASHIVTSRQSVI